MKHTGLVKNTLLLFLNKISLVLSSFVLLPVFTSNFTPADYGLATLIAGYITLLAPILTLRMDIGIFKHLIDVRGDREGIKTLTSSFIFLLIPIIILFLSLAVCVGFIYDIPFYSLIILNILISILFTLISQFARGIGMTNSYVLVSFVVTTLSLAASLIGIIMLDIGIEIIFLAAILSQFVGLIILCVKARVGDYISKGYIDKMTQRQLVKYSLPLVPDSMSYWVMNISDRTILSIFLGVASAGVYTVANKFSTIVDQAIGVFFQAWTESATEYAKSDNRDQLYSDVFSIYLRVFVAICILITASMPFVFNILIKGEGFQSAYIYIPILMYAMIAHAAEAFISSIYLANNLTKQIAKTTFFGAIVNIVMNVILVAFIGIWAAAISTLISYLATAVYRYYNVRKYGITLKLSSWLMTSFSLIIIFSATMYYWNHPLGNIVSFAVCFVAMISLNYKILSSGMIIAKRILPDTILRK